MVIHILRWAFDERRTSCVSRKLTNLMNFSKEDFEQQPQQQQKQRETKKSYNEDIFIYLYTPPPSPHTHSHTKKNVNR